MPVLGVILAITLASTAQLHLEFNKIEERAGKRILIKSRAGISGATYMLIWLFFASAMLVVIKPIVCDSERAQAICNSLGVFLLVFNIVILIEITQAAFSIPPHFDDRNRE